MKKLFQIHHRCTDLCLVFTELCNALSYYMINEPNSQLGDLNCLNLLLMCSTHADYEVFQKTFNFWFNISEEIYTHNNSIQLCDLFRDYVYSLIDRICKHCRYGQNNSVIIFTFILVSFKLTILNY
jgi:hypothetical protein